MKKSITLLLLLIVTLSFGQKTNLDREYFKASYISLPSHPIEDPSQRTYSSNNSKIYIAGFKKASSPTITIIHQFDETRSDFVEVKTRVEVKKDKEGKVISRTTHYAVVVDYSSVGSVDVQNAITGKGYNKLYELKDRYTSGEYKSSSEAIKSYNRSKSDLYSRYSKQHRDAMRSSTNFYVNDRYGYPVNNKKDNFWILGKKKHPEYTKHVANYNKAKTILAKMKHNEPIDDIAKELEPVIKYFDETAKKYTGKKKRERKMRYASYYNNAKIYYYLDNPAKTREYANKLIANDHRKAQGKTFIAMANKLEKRLKANKVTSRHLITRE